MSTKQITTIIIIVLLVAGVSFYGGMKYDQGHAPTRGNGQFAGQFGGAGGTGRGTRGGGFVAGDIFAKDTTSITVKMRDGSTKIVFVSASTDVQKTVGGSSADLIVGKSVTVQGTANADGSVTAQSVSLRTTPLIPPQGQTLPAPAGQ